MHHVDVFDRLSVVALRDLKSAAATLRDLMARLPARRISVRPLSGEWRRQHERDSAKRPPD
ncbi:MAG: hypothetical protein ACRD26_21580 [Vicinamibacterales bacterium]